MTITAKVVLDSINGNGNRLTTQELYYPRFGHADFMSHRAFSRNGSSSRATPFKYIIKQILRDMAMPVSWGKNQAGMQARSDLSPFKAMIAKGIWKSSGYAACGFAYALYKLGVHKQIVNRIVEPWSHIKVIVSSTEWDNFFALRCHEDAQPEVQSLANAMREAMENSNPELLEDGDWHCPYVGVVKKDDALKESKKKKSSACCARTSYLNFFGKPSTQEQDEALFDKLAGSQPIHASPFEHVATPDSSAKNNFRGYRQMRQDIEVGLK